MKKFYFLFLFALIASISNLYAAEKTVTTTFTDNDLAVGAGEPEWESSIAATAFETSGSKRGVQFGAAKGIFTLKTKVSFSKVKNVSVLLSSNGNGNTVSLKVGVASVGKKVSIVKKNNYSVEWTAESPQDGIVELSFNDAAKSIYIKSISITYEEAAETKCAQPTFNLTADATYTDVQDLVITSTTEGAQIEYKIEGDKLTAPITGKQASPATVHLTANGTYMVTATATKEGLDASESAVLMFTIAKKMNKPTFNLTEGAVYGEAKLLVITSDKEGAQIKYTIVGGGNLDITKTEASPVNVTLDQNGDYTVEAFALGMDDYAKSDAAGLNFRIELAAGVPTFSVEEGTYSEAQTITLAPGEGGEKVFYTINDGTEQQYIEPIKLEEEGIYKIAAYTAATETLAKSASVTKTYVINFPLDEPYILCENAAWLTEGTKIIFVGEKDGKYYGLSKVNGNFLTGGLVTISAKELTEKDVTVKVFVVGRTANGVTFNTAAGYLAAGKTAKAANLSYAAGNEGDCFHWTVSVANGEATVVNADVTGDYNNLQFNPSAKTPRFGAYADSYKNGNLSIYLLGSTSSVSSMSAEGVKVFAAEGGVEVVADEAADVAVYTVAGQLVRQARVAEGSTLVNVAPGFYVVRANGTATKVIVR
uniref:chitobiase/beta-hexosaminidase C-terminal domain-containing protein n=1 Tax=Candidatus Limisoma sp. TaxID=3076476 RepID=UPI003FF02155